VVTSRHGVEVLRFNLKPFRVADIHSLLAVPELKYEERDDVA
jgi:hypothetical protein